VNGFLLKTKLKVIKHHRFNLESCMYSYVHKRECYLRWNWCISYLKPIHSSSSQMNKVKVEVENTLVSDMHLLKNSYN